MAGDNPTQTTAEDVRTIRKEEVVEVYEDLLSKLWGRMTTTLGVVTARAMMHRSLILTARNYSHLEMVQVSDEGLQVAELKSRVSEREKDALKAGFEELILVLFDLLAELTGQAIVDKLFRDERLLAGQRA